jgi:signal transduction histidine kinase
VLDDLGLPAALEALVRDASARHALRGEIRQDRSSRRLTSTLEVAIYRIAQEAITNVIRHSQAGTLRVALGYAGDMVSLTVEDDGRGFMPATPGGGAADGLGLLSIRERATQLRGTMQVASDARGTRLSVQLPAQFRQPAEGPESAITGMES